MFGLMRSESQARLFTLLQSCFGFCKRLREYDRVSLAGEPRQMLRFHRVLLGYIDVLS
jgi:hypothetical protein